MIDVILDIAQGAGFTFLQDKRNKLSLELPIFIVSRHTSREDITRALELGANDFIPKPIDDIYLIQKINHYLKKWDLKPLPYFKVSEKDWSCEFSYDIAISEVSEFGLVLESEHFLTKGTYLELSGDFLAHITGQNTPLKSTICQSWKDESSGLYRSFVEFDASNESLLSSVRSFILNQDNHNG